MGILRKKSTAQESEKIEFSCDDVCVLTTQIKSSISHKTIIWYVLAYEQENKYYEIFSGKLIKQLGTDENLEDELYIIDIDPLRKFVKDTNIKTVSGEDLFEYITIKNVEAAM